MACLGIMSAAQPGDLAYVEILDEDLEVLDVHLEPELGDTPILQANQLHRNLVMEPGQVLPLVRRIAERTPIVPKISKANLRKLATSPALRPLVPEDSWLLR